MKLLKQSIVFFIGCFVFNNLALAETVNITGTAYGSTISTEETELSDGNFKYINLDHSIWVQEGMPFLSRRNIII